MTRDEVLGELARRIVQVKRPHPIRVAIDGVDAAGKTMLADELVAPIEGLGRSVIRASIDGFHNPAAVRYRRGNTDPEGYFVIRSTAPASSRCSSDRSARRGTGASGGPSSTSGWIHL